ncbi:MAG: S-layer homology domain-containing protein [Gottschalkiaceae bacterium]|nr:MAG: S-layer homology domain-containing protein [Gottschalkiaceae bacterium]
MNEYSKQITDYNTINDKDNEYVLKAYVKGIITGYTDGTFKPNNSVTRAEASTMLVRLLEPSKRIIPIIKSIETEQAKDDFTPTIDREKIIEELKKYPTDNKDVEDYPEYSDITFSNSIFVENWKRESDIIHDQTINFINVLFNRDYENISKTYKDDLIVYFRSWLLYNGIDNLTPDSFVNMWIKETKEYKIKQESFFVTDKSLSYISNNGVRVRGRLFFRYLNHENPDNIRFELEKEDKSFKVGKWYFVDVDIEWWRPLSNVPYTHKPKSDVLYSYSNYLSEFKIIEK